MDNIVKKVCKELGITERGFNNLLRVEKNLPPLLNSLKLVEFELKHLNINSSLYQAITKARKEVEKITLLNHYKVVSNLLDEDKSSDYYIYITFKSFNQCSTMIEYHKFNFQFLLLRGQILIIT